MVHLIGAESLGISYPNRLVLDSVSLGIESGDRIGVVGRNGDGKSTLMRALAGIIEPHTGRVTRRSGTTVSVLDQSDAFEDGASVGRAIVGDGAAYEWASEPQIRDVISGLASDLDWEAPLTQLSGGQRRRVALARALVAQSDVLMLDEPTNHLDIEGITWLAGHLATRWTSGQGALLVVTHDRWFLDAVATATWEVHDGTVEPFEGGYAAYILQRVERDRQAATAETKRQNILRKELAWLRRGAPARTSKPKFRLDAASELISGEPEPRDSVQLHQLAIARLGKRVVDLEDVDAGYGDRTVLHDVTWLIAPGERTGILGRNGAGKSTLLSLIRGELEPSAGHVRRGKTARIATLTQQAPKMAEIGDKRVLDVIADYKTGYLAGGKELSPSQMLERLGFTREHLSTQVKDLSGGQRRRLQLLLVLLDEPNVLILDEPSNDMDTDMLAAIEDLLDSWPGTLLVVSHDRYLLERVTDRQYAVMGGTLRHMPGGVEEYLQLSRTESSETGSAASPMLAASPKQDPSTKSVTPHQLRGADRRTAQKEITSIERRLEKLSTQIKQAHEQMAAYDQSDYEGLQELSGVAKELEEQADQLELRWLELSDQLE